jgi:predicted nucleotidyltransferase
MENVLPEKVDRKKLQELFTSVPVVKAYLFGSFAHNKQTGDSDIDVLVELDKGVDLLDFIEIKHQLEELFGREVDLVSTKGINKRIAPFINESKELIYERGNGG